MTFDLPTPRRFDIALSFPGEHRGYVAEVAAHLATTFGEERVLYDKYHDAEFARLDLNTYLPALYRKESELIVIFLCPEYAAKHWCKLEWRHISQLIATVDAKRIMFFSFGNPGDLSDIGILGGDGYIDIIQLAPQTAAEKIFKRLGINQGVTAKPKSTASTFQPDISRIIKYAPADLIGREAETKLLDDAWHQADNNAPKRPHILTFVALGGEGKTSLVAKWAAGLAHDNWPGCEAAFAWSFYSQGTREQTAASSDLFLDAALEFFGDTEMAGSAQHASEKGKRLAQLVGARRALLILDGVEPLQYAPTSPMPGELKDQGLAALLKGLAASSHGLCVVTTRYTIPDLKAYRQTTAPEIALLRLSEKAGVALLKALGVHGAEKEFEELVEDVKGHALTLNLLGGFLKRAHHGDIRQRDRVKFAKADAKTHDGHAFRTMAAYEQWLLEGGDEGRREVAILRMTGLFDRPADAGCLAALRETSIPGLTEPLAGLEQDDWEYSLSGLENAKLLTLNRDAGGALLSLDAHPLLREYFAKQLREQHPEAWRAAHQRLYVYLCETTKEGAQPTLADLQPLYQAVAHGCLAGMQQEACDKVYRDRIQRGDEAYSVHKLGAFGSDLGAVACFFDTPWSRVSPKLAQAAQAWLLNEAAFRLHALGRLTEALELMRVSGEMDVKVEEWKGAAISASNLSELELTLGMLDVALNDAGQSVSYADQSGDAFQRMNNRATHADALHQAGRVSEAEARFREAEAMQAEDQPDYPLLYSVQGFRYCDLLLAAAERAAWRERQDSGCGIQDSGKSGERAESGEELAQALRAVSGRAAQTLQWAEQNNAALLTIALDHLTLGRAALYAAILEGSSPTACHASIQHAVDGLRRSGNMDDLPRGLLTRAWLRMVVGWGEACEPQRLGQARDGHVGAANAGVRASPPACGQGISNGSHPDHEGAKADLDEAMEIAERGPMPLHMADIYLHRARLFFDATPYPWKNPDTNPRSAKDDLAEARRLIEKHGYWRRKEELEDAEAAVKHQSETRKPITLERPTKMKIPNPVICAVGDVLGTWYYSHTKLNTLFGEVGFPGEPPEGNCVKKCQSWLKRANDTQDVDPLELLGGVLLEFMNLDRQDDSNWQGGFRRVTDALAKNGLAFDPNGGITATPFGVVTTPEATLTSPPE